MKYFGLQGQIRKNNTNSVLLLMMFPLVFYGLTWLFFFFMSVGEQDKQLAIADVNRSFFSTIPWITVGVIAWFVIAWFSHTSIINSATNSKPLERKENNEYIIL